MAKESDIRGMKTYEELYNFGFAAVAKLDARAKDTTDVGQRKALRQKSKEIMQFLFKLRKAEIVVLKTPTSHQSAGDQLRHAVKVAKRDLRKLEDLSTALEAATELLNMATRLVKLTI